MRPSSGVLVGSIAFTSVAASDLSAQAASSARCDIAAQVIAKGHPTKGEREAFRSLLLCGVVGARALASGVDQYTTETDVEVLDDFMDQVDNWRTTLSALTNSPSVPEPVRNAARWCPTR